MDHPHRETQDFAELLDLARTLRAPGGCPWDRAQDFRTMRRYLLEEAYELLEAVDLGDPDALEEELGDLLFLLLFYLILAEEKHLFTASSTLRRTIAKMRRRHPHVFESRDASTEHEAFLSWESAKREEKWSGKEGSVLDGVPRALPALTKARRIQERASAVGFDWKEPPGALAKLEEELAEFRAALAAGDREKVGAEIGDVLFSLVNVARLLDHDPEAELEGTNAKFRRRFAWIERTLAARSSPLTLEEMDRLWDEAKRSEDGKA